MYIELKSAKLIPVLRKIPYETSQLLIQALIDGGIKAIEITMDTDNATEIIRKTIENFGNRVLVGAGTVLSLEDCQQALEAGAQFIVSPTLNLDVVRYCKMNQIAVVPGVFTPTEMQEAYRAGAEMIKLFPASALSPSFVKDVRGPLSHISIMTTGGITLQNARSYITAGASVVGAGSDLINKSLVENKQWHEIKQETKKWLQAIL